MQSWSMPTINYSYRCCHFCVRDQADYRHCDSQVWHMTPVLPFECSCDRLQQRLPVKNSYSKHPATDRTNEQWINKWMNEWLTGWMDGWVNERTHARTHRWMNEHMNECIPAGCHQGGERPARQRGTACAPCCTCGECSAAPCTTKRHLLLQAFHRKPVYVVKVRFVTSPNDVAICFVLWCVSICLSCAEHCNLCCNLYTVPV